jgi:hypothetical protein
MLMAAAFNGHSKVVRYLAEQCFAHVDWCDRRGETAMFKVGGWVGGGGGWQQWGSGRCLCATCTGAGKV